MCSFWHGPAEDDGIYCLVGEHWLSTAFRSVLWDTLSALGHSDAAIKWRYRIRYRGSRGGFRLSDTAPMVISGSRVE